MTLPLPDVRDIEAVLFDMNGTLRVREPHEATQRAALHRLLEFLGKEEASVNWAELMERQRAYSNWAREHLIQLSEAEIWSRWMLPEYPREQVEAAAAELMLAWSERKGRTVPLPGAEAALVELKRRGYRLGVISNTMSTLDIPRSLEAFGWAGYFEVVILSSFLKVRKPSPGPFLDAALRLGLPSERCAYLGNRITKDLPGCKQAGYGLGILIEPLDKPRIDVQEQSLRPDAVVHSLTELLDFFPGRVRR